jgi:ribosomal protein S18 acetylase RimI-like enzyme
MITKIRLCTIEDLDALVKISKNTFRESYAHNNDPVQFEAYIAKALNKNQLSEELKNQNSKFYFCENDKDIVGYLKINFSESQTDINDHQSIEIERIYLKKEFQRLGLGSIILDFVIEIAKSNAKKYVWLGVWDQNPKAIAFYKKNGFIAFGEHTFAIGSIDQIDILFKKYI